MTTQKQRPGSRSSPVEIDPRGPQFNAMLTSLVLALSLIAAPSPVGVALLGVQAALFAVAVAFGVQRTPAAYLFRTFVRPRLAAPPAPRGPGTTALRPGGRSRLRSWSASSGTSPAHPSWVPSRPASPWRRRC